jgi:predicted nucleic acid-binding protein
MSGSFFDSNVVLYHVSLDLTKAARARSLLEKGGTISVQVLNEIANATRKKMKLSWPEVRLFLGGMRSLLHVRPVTLTIHEKGIELAERYQLSIYDAMIAAAALDADCDTLWSEDMQDGMIIENLLRIANPFRGAI